MIEIINKALKDIYTLRFNSKYKKVSSSKTDNCNNGYGSQGEYDEIQEVYDLNYEGLFLKLTLTTDSYGNNETISSIQLVKPTTKTVTVYE